MLQSLLSRFRKPADPYEDFYLHSAAVDPRNQIDSRIRQAPEGSVFAVKADTHTPEIMSDHVKELGRFFEADLVHIASTAGFDFGAELDATTELPYAVFCLFRAEHDPRDAAGIGGHIGSLKGAFATFQMSAIIREFGYRAERFAGEDRDALASQAGLGALNENGRLVAPRFGTGVHIADIIMTDLPVAPDSGAR